MLLTQGRALAYATLYSPWTPVERACTTDAPCDHGTGAGGAMPDASGGRVVMVFVARQASGPAGVVQRYPSVHAVDGGIKERKERRDGGVWSEGPGARTSQRRAGHAGTRRSGAAWDGPQWGRRRRAYHGKASAPRVVCQAVWPGLSVEDGPKQSGPRYREELPPASYLPVLDSMPCGRKGTDRL